MDKINNESRVFLKKVYKNDRGTLIGIPKKLTQELKLNNESYVKLYFDRKNQCVQLSKLPLDEEKGE